MAPVPPVRAASDAGVQGDGEAQLLFEIHRMRGTRVTGVLVGAEDIPPPCGFS